MSKKLFEEIDLIKRLEDEELYLDAVDDAISEILTLRAENARLRAECETAAEYIALIEGDAIEYAGSEVFEREAWGYKKEKETYYTARATRETGER